MGILYSLKNIVQRFDGREILNIPELTLEEKRIYVLQGPNGAGKTTLMRILSFMDTPAEGEIAFKGEKVSPEHSALFRARVVWVPQSPVMFTGTLLYNVEYPMRIKGVHAAGRKARAMELLESVNLAALARAPAHKLSGGESQRGSIARALAAGAEVILFDEPTASVDYRSRQEIILLIRSLCEDRGLSLAVTTHDAALADELAQERISLFEGRLAEKGTKISFAGGREVSTAKRFDAVGRLEKKDGEFFLHVSPSETFDIVFQGELMQLRALSEESDGFLLTLAHDIRHHSADVHIFLPLKKNERLARELNLGCTLKLCCI